MGHKIAWFGEIKEIVRHFSTPEQVEIGVRLTEGVPARQSGRTVRVRMTPERALDWSTELASHARSARRRNGGRVRLTDSDRISEVERIRRDYAETTGLDNDPVTNSLADLMADLIKVAERHGLDPDEVIDTARDYASETADLEIRYYVD